MTEHEHMPPINMPYTARRLERGRVTVNMPGRQYVLTTEEADRLCESVWGAVVDDLMTFEMPKEQVRI